MRIAAGILLTLAAAFAAPIRERAPGPKSKGKLFEWKAKDGLRYRYFVPRSYDAKRGANLTFVLHGSNLDYRWGFANHPAGKFRPDDIVVSPDGTTPNGRGGFNFLQSGNDLERLRALHRELQETFRIRATYLYGHSQGSFFVFLYAGAYPREVAGVVGHASAVWIGTELSPQHHHQAIVVMHGTADPVVPYGAGVSAFETYREAKYPLLHFRSLEGWNHWPAEVNGPIPHTSQQLAWCEGMTTNDPERMATCFELLADARKKEQHDWAGAYTLARRIASVEAAPETLRKRADRAMEAIDALAAMRVAALKAPADAAFDGKPWIGHLPMFLRAFRDVPAREALARDWEPVLARQRAAAEKAFAGYRAAKAGAPAEAFARGVDVLRDAFLMDSCAAPSFLSQMKAWRDRARDLGLDAKVVREYDKLRTAFEKALTKGRRAFEAVNRKAGRL